MEDSGGTPPLAPKTKDDHRALLDRHGIPHHKSDTLDALKKLCAGNGLVAPQPPSEKDRLLDMLRLCGIECSARAGVAQLRALCQDHGLIEPEYKEVEEYSIVKCALRKALGGLGDEYSAFIPLVEDYVNVVSRMLRRGSLALAYHITRLLASGQSLPDLYDQKDTYWKDWLRLNPDSLPTAPHVKLALEVQDSGHVNVGLKVEESDHDARASYDAIRGDLDDVYLDGVEGFVKEQPRHFDQVVNYAGHALQTMVTNNAWVPLWVRLQRLCSAKLRVWRRSGAIGSELHADKMVRAIRSADPVWDGLPGCARRWVEAVRARLCAVEGTPLYDDHGHKKLTFQQAMEFNHWMQRSFHALGERKMRLMPIAGVHRAHVRLDSKTLLLIFSDIFPQHPAIAAVDQLTAAHVEAMSAAGFGKCTGSPDKHMLPAAPAKPKKSERTEAAVAAHKAALEEHALRVERIKASATYTQLLASYAAHKAGRAAALQSFFAAIPLRKGWSFSGSLVTDGVSASIQYTRVVQRRVVPKPRKASTKARAARETVAGQDYPRHLGTASEDLVVLGLDPGRTNLATIAYILDSGLRKSWTLTRGQYRLKSGICSEEASKAKRYSGMAAAFHELAGDGSMLRTCWPDAIHEYMRRYRAVSCEWWALALRREESRAALRLYMGKRRALDGFFSKVLRSVRATFPGRRIEVAYGESGLTMSPTGKGEVAVPTGGTYKACCRAVAAAGVGAVTPTDESMSTAVSWETGQRKEIVYRIVDELGRLGLDHTPAKSPPQAPVNLQEAVSKYRQSLRAKELARKKNGARSDTTTSTTDALISARYPEVRGLRFCPETRMYIGRDVEAAITIARLRVLEIKGQPRPAPFCR